MLQFFEPGKFYTSLNEILLLSRYVPHFSIPFLGPARTRVAGRVVLLNRAGGNGVRHCLRGVGGNCGSNAGTDGQYFKVCADRRRCAVETRDIVVKSLHRGTGGEI